MVFRAVTFIVIYLYVCVTNTQYLGLNWKLHRGLFVNAAFVTVKENIVVVINVL